MEIGGQIASWMFSLYENPAQVPRYTDTNTNTDATADATADA